MAVIVAEQTREFALYRSVSLFSQFDVAKLWFTHIELVIHRVRACADLYI